MSRFLSFCVKLDTKPRGLPKGIILGLIEDFRGILTPIARLIQVFGLEYFVVIKSLLIVEFKVSSLFLQVLYQMKEVTKWMVSLQMFAYVLNVVWDLFVDEMLFYR